MKLTDRLADRMMELLPKQRLWVIALHVFSGGLVFGALARLLGWPLLLAAIAAGCASAWVALAGQIRGWWNA
jgi:hypothetical protein